MQPVAGAPTGHGRGDSAAVRLCYRGHRVLPAEPELIATRQRCVLRRWLRGVRRGLIRCDLVSLARP